ncbi:MAG TPA: DNA internalization-related competence protein ComEC/Rec2 [Gemmatimonadaceae bacterium]
MPLVTLAYVAVAAGLLMGSGGAVFPAVGGAVLAAAVAIWRRSLEGVSLAGLAAAGSLTGWSVARADISCAVALEANGYATVRLREEAKPGASARGFALGSGCRVPIRIRVTSGSAPAGATVHARGEARREGARVSMAEARVRVEQGPGILARWRTRAGATIDLLYGDQAPLARALLIADERDIAPEIRRQFADAGIIHMLSVSGLHVAVLAEGVVLVLMIAGASTRRAELAATITIAAFVLFVGAPSPAVRSAAMYAALVLSRRLQRPTSPWALLALGAALPLIQPRVVNEIGYHLSVAGMAGLIASGRLSRRLPLDRVPEWSRRLAREVLATIVASAVTAPIVAWHFGRVSLAAPLTNLAAAPLFGLAQPVLFLSLALAPVRAVAALLADGTRVLLAGIEKVGVIGAAIPASALDVQPSAVTAALLAAASASLLAACASRHWGRPALVSASALCVALWWPVVRLPGSRLELHMIDVGQGDAIALRTPRWRWILVDAGDQWREGDVGERVVVPYLRRRGGEIAAFILSHPHADHIGGAASVIRRLPVAFLWDGGFPQGSSVYEGVLDAARERGVPWRAARAGGAIEIDGVRLTVLSPDSAEIAGAPDANAASVVVMAEYRGVRILLTGDAERDVEARLARRFGRTLRADVLKVGHHGSATSTTPPLLEAVEPRLALVSVGAGNRYGHPSPEVLGALRSRGAQALRTDDGGSIVVGIDGTDNLQVSTEDSRWTLRRSRPAVLRPGPG